METEVLTVEQRVKNRVARLPLEVVCQVLWHMGDRVLGYQPGSFMESLFQTIGRADAFNRVSLLQVFPDEVETLRIAGDEVGLELLRDRAKAAGR